MTRAAWLALVASAACSSGAAPRPTPVRTAVAGAVAVTPAASLAVASEDVTFSVGTNPVPGTLVHPIAPGRYPAIVLMAGSGPTDRDWNSPLLPAKNGSAKLLADALARHGAIVLRFDKAGVGGNHARLDAVTIDVYRDEGRAALALLRGRPDVDPAHLFVAGHSEGGIHAMRVALAEGDRVAGLLLLSAGGRSMKDVILGQLEPQLRSALPLEADADLAAVHQALDDFLAGKPVDPGKVTTLPPVQQLVAAIVNPATAMLARGLISFDPLPTVAQIGVPVFVFNGEKDIQVDPRLDAARLEQARKAAGKDVTLFLAPEANHVLKHEPRAVGDLRKDLGAVSAGYNADDRVLDDATVAALVGWLAKQTAAVSSSRP